MIQIDHLGYFRNWVYSFIYIIYIECPAIYYFYYVSRGWIRKYFCIQIKIDEYIVRDKNIICNQRKWINKKCALNVNAVPRSKMKNHPGGQKRVFSLSHAISNSRKSVCTSSAHFSLSLSLFRIFFFLFSIPLSVSDFYHLSFARGEKRQNVRLVGRLSWQRLRQLGENWIDSGVRTMPSFPAGFVGGQ